MYNLQLQSEAVGLSVLSYMLLTYPKKTCSNGLVGFKGYVAKGSLISHSDNNYPFLCLVLGQQSEIVQYLTWPIQRFLSDSTPATCR